MFFILTINHLPVDILTGENKGADKSKYVLWKDNDSILLQVFKLSAEMISSV